MRVKVSFIPKHLPLPGKAILKITRSVKPHDQECD